MYRCNLHATTRDGAKMLFFFVASGLVIHSTSELDTASEVCGSGLVVHLIFLSHCIFYPLAQAIASACCLTLDPASGLVGTAMFRADFHR